MGVLGLYIYVTLEQSDNELLLLILTILVMAAMFVILALTGYRIYAYYSFLEVRGWDQYGNSKDLLYQDIDDSMDYKLFASPNVLKLREPAKEKSKVKKI